MFIMTLGSCIALMGLGASIFCMKTPLSLLTKNCLRAANAARECTVHSRVAAAPSWLFCTCSRFAGTSAATADVVAHEAHEEHDEDDWDQHPVSDRRVERELVHDSAVLERAWALLPPKVHTCSKLLLYSAPCANPPSPIPRLRAAKPQSPASGATHFW